ncbi:MAG: hypothetical protein ABIR92_05900 [Gemmatimonadaceae bacterium]
MTSSTAPAQPGGGGRHGGACNFSWDAQDYFKIDLSNIPSKMQRGIDPEYMAIFEDNDSAKRMLAIIDNYADVGELIQFSDEGFNPVPANEAYKLWVNYFIYALTH